MNDTYLSWAVTKTPMWGSNADDIVLIGREAPAGFVALRISGSCAHSDQSDKVKRHHHPKSYLNGVFLRYRCLEIENFLQGRQKLFDSQVGPSLGQQDSHVIAAPSWIRTWKWKRNKGDLPSNLNKLSCQIPTDSPITRKNSTSLGLMCLYQPSEPAKTSRNIVQLPRFKSVPRKPLRWSLLQ